MGSASSLAVFRRVETVPDSTSTGANAVLDSNDRLHVLEVDNTGNTVAVFTKGQRAASYVAGDPFDLLVRTNAGAKSRTYLGHRAGFQSASGWSFITTTENTEAGTTSPTSDVKLRLLSLTLPT